MWILRFQLIPSINLEKFYHDLNEKLITTTNTLNDSVLEVNLSKHQEVGYLYSGTVPDEAISSDQGHLSAVWYSITLLI